MPTSSYRRPVCSLHSLICNISTVLTKSSWTYFLSWVCSLRKNCVIHWLCRAHHDDVFFCHCNIRLCWKTCYEFVIHHCLRDILSQSWLVSWWKLCLHRNSWYLWFTSSYLLHLLTICFGVAPQWLAVAKIFVIVMYMGILQDTFTLCLSPTGNRWPWCPIWSPTELSIMTTMASGSKGFGAVNHLWIYWRD